MLRENNAGILEGKSIKEYVRAAKEAGFTKSELATYTPQGGETLHDLKNRVTRFMDMISDIKPFAKKKRVNILAATHLVYIAQLIGYLYEDIKCAGLPIEEIKITDGVLNILKTKIPNTSITTFDIEVDNFNKRIKSCNCSLFNSNAHISSPRLPSAFAANQPPTVSTLPEQNWRPVVPNILNNLIPHRIPELNISIVYIERLSDNLFG